MILKTTEIVTKKKSFPVKCDICQGYGDRVDTCASLNRVVIIDEVSTAAPKLYNTIPPVVTSVLKEFSDILKEFQDKHQNKVFSY